MYHLWFVQPVCSSHDFMYFNIYKLVIENWPELECLVCLCSGIIPFFFCISTLFSFQYYATLLSRNIFYCQIDCNSKYWSMSPALKVFLYVLTGLLWTCPSIGTSHTINSVVHCKSLFGFCHFLFGHCLVCFLQINKIPTGVT